MQKGALSSRDRLMATLNHQEPDHVPVMFWGTIAPLRDRWKDRFDRVLKLRELGVDDQMTIGAPWAYHPDVKVTVTRDNSHADYPRLTKTLETPKGTLRLTVKKTPDYPWDNPPLVGDHNWSRATEFLVKGPEDLDKLRYLFYDTAKTDLTSFRENAKRVRQFCAEEHVLVNGHAASPSNFAMGLVGASNMMMHSVDNLGFIEELLDIIHTWSTRRLEIVLEEGPDTVQFSGIYESTAFWSPRDFAQLFLPRVKEYADLAHHAGATFHYFSDARIMDHLETFRDMGVDALSYLNPPPMGDADLAEIKRRVGDTICLWGGVSAPLTIEQGTSEDVREAVKSAIRVAAPGGGFILATADAIMKESAYDNMMTMIRTCREFGKYPIRI
ncbi:MAG: uroporphyrinogen decarboxylase family protein [Planctomycetota bacterium]